jgi:hypothetical protein
MMFGALFGNRADYPTLLDASKEAYLVIVLSRGLLMSDAKLDALLAANKHLKTEVAELRRGIQGIIDAFMQFDHFSGEDAHAIASRLLEQSKSRLPE